MAPSRSRQSTAARQNDYCRWTADGIKFIGRSGGKSDIAAAKIWNYGKC